MSNPKEMYVHKCRISDKMKHILKIANLKTENNTKEFLLDCSAFFPHLTTHINEITCYTYLFIL